MRIVDVRTILLTGPITHDPSVARLRPLRSAAFIEIHTDAELVGIGETYLGYFIPEMVPALVDFFKPILIGVGELDIEILRNRMFDCCTYWGRVGIGPAVISGIEAALWDLKGKASGLPVYELLGGKRHEELPAYATGGPANWPLDRLLAKVDRYLEHGFRAFKVATGYFDEDAGAMISVNGDRAAEFEAAKIESLRGHVGPDIGILIDGHMGFKHGPERWSVPTAQAVLKALEPFKIALFEEPLPYDDPAGYAELRQITATPIAGGESLTRIEEFQHFASAHAFDVAQPDAAWVGGLAEFLAVGRLFAAEQCEVATHAWGAGAAVMQNLHAAFATPNLRIVELPPTAGPLHVEIWGDSLQMRGGKVLAPSAPGLGVQLTEQMKERFPFVPGTGEHVNVPGKVMRAIGDETWINSRST